ncbi:MAG: hypothetical protein CVT63_03545 [Candidatus Anoxymicrobium japonicum]|uniref:Glycosyltransferase RgtA/B/C/D-like domain-containing protein n=1 Tax=Candidatus Anoxymicrobium japonicum TaxID=2013648 RepID=A0A2N3G6E4_9ACTN|nr:MAG: hypothetical protein CVT63_03545 [Candidatus Anoxymicrobium japonicum]
MQETRYHIENATYRRLALYLVAVFALFQALYFALGVRFDGSSLPWFWQYLDPALLRTRLLESVLYLHSQPPLFNLFLGIVLKLAPDREMLLFQAIYLVCGLVFYWSIFSLQVELGVSKTIALILSTLFMASPSFVLYENWLFYTFPLATLVTLSALLLYEALARDHRWALWLFFTVLFLIAGIRSLFHFSFFIFVTAALAILNPAHRRRIAVAALIPFILLMSLYGKNQVLFGRFTTSTWMGMNVWTMTARNLPLVQRLQLIAEGKLSAVSQYDRFSELARYPATYLLGTTQYEDIPALQQVRKSTGYSNFNHVAYMSIADDYLKDALYVLKHDPPTYVSGSLRSWYAYFRSSSDYVFLAANRAKLAAINDVYDYLFYGKIPFDLARVPHLPIYTDSRGHCLYLFLLVGLPLVVGYGLRLFFTDKSLTRAQRITIMYLCFVVIFVALLGNFLETGENNRFRFMTDPFSLALLGLFMRRWVARRLNRTSGAARYPHNRPT